MIDFSWLKTPFIKRFSPIPLCCWIWLYIFKAKAIPEKIRVIFRANLSNLYLSTQKSFCEVRIFSGWYLNYECFNKKPREFLYLANKVESKFFTAEMLEFNFKFHSDKFKKFIINLIEINPKLILPSHWRRYYEAIKFSKKHQLK